MLTALQIAMGAQLILVADRVPELKYEPSCRAAIQADRTTTGSRNEYACLQDEKAAKAKLREEWAQFSGDQKGHCLRLQNAGGMPSYVELLTCVEMGKAVRDLNAQQTVQKRNGSGTETMGQSPAEAVPPR
jgi:hypothetical protein